jgi:hypothetical protein
LCILRYHEILMELIEKEKENIQKVKKYLKKEENVKKHEDSEEKFFSCGVAVSS